MRPEHVLAGIFVVLAIEGLLYALAPGAMRRVVSALAGMPDRQLRAGGLAAAAIGIGAATLLTR